MHNWRRYLSILKLIKIDQKMRSGIWRFTVATQTLYSHAAQKNRNIGAHFPHVQNSPKDDLENLPPV